MSLSAGLRPKHNIARFQCLSCQSEPISFVSKSRGSFVKSSLYAVFAMSAISGANTSTFLVLLMELSAFLWCAFAWWEVIPWASIGPPLVLPLDILCCSPQLQNLPILFLIYWCSLIDHLPSSLSWSSSRWCSPGGRGGTPLNFNSVNVIALCPFLLLGDGDDVDAEDDEAVAGCCRFWWWCLWCL